MARRSWELEHGVLNLYAPITAADARAIARDRVSLIQLVIRPAPIATLRALDQHVLARHPRADLRITLNGAGAFDDLGFLAHLPRLRALSVDGSAAIDLAPLVRHGGIVDLGVGGRGTSLAPLAGSRTLRRLFVHERIRDLPAIGTIRGLTSLTIGGQSPPGLGFLAGHPRLRALAFSFVAPKRFDELLAIPALRELTIWRARKLAPRALAPLARSRLAKVTLRELPHLTSLAWLPPTVTRLELEDVPATPPRRAGLRVRVV